MQAFTTALGLVYEALWVNPKKIQCGFMCMLSVVSDVWETNYAISSLAAPCFTNFALVSFAVS
jgi:hypothetical protein